MEGLEMNGARCGARFIGTFEAETFAQACRKAFKEDSFYDPMRNSYFGCRLYDNEADARKTFG